MAKLFDLRARELGLVLLLAALAFLGFNSAVVAQQVSGSIYGTVTDNSGAAVSKARITITDLSKNTNFETVTNDTGNYEKGQLIPGTYRVNVEAPGFSTVTSSGIQVTVDQAARFDVTLKVGAVQEQVQVTAAAPLLQTDRADIAQTYTSREISELPNFGRNVQSFELLTPGTSQFGWQQNNAENPQQGVMINVNGQPWSASDFDLDGTTNQDPILGIIIINPTMDSVNEVKQATQEFDAEFGYAGGGHMSYSTKSGSNSFHGSAFEYIYLNTPGFQDFGRNPFNAAENTEVPPVRWNQFGGSVSGPIVKNKLFFFGDAQLTRRSQGSSIQTSVPTAAARSGDLSAYINNGQNIIYDPATGNQQTGVGRMAFANNVIPASKISPQATAILSYLPLPNSVEPTSGLAFRNNYAVSGVQTINSNAWDTRWDYYLNEKNSIFGRYSYAGFTIQAPGAFGFLAGGPAFSGYAGNSDVLNQSVATGWTHTFSPTLVNELRVGYLRYHVQAVPNGVGTSPAKDAGIPGLNLDSYYSSGMPAFLIHGDQVNTGATNIGYALSVNSCNCPLTEIEGQYQLVDNLSKTIGNHNLKFGADIRYARNLRVPSDSHRAGELTFSPGDTGIVDPQNGAVTQGYGLATFLLGNVTGFTRYVSSTTDAEDYQKRQFYYAQDRWRVTPKFSLSYGLRWELIFPETVNAPGNGGILDTRTGDINAFGVGLVSNHGLQQMNWHNFAPRLGFAYQLNSKTVIRGGTGWSYNLGTFGALFSHVVSETLPVLAAQSINAPQAFSDVFTLAQGPPAATLPKPNAYGLLPLPNGVSAGVRQLSVIPPLIMAYNLTVDRQLTNKIDVTAGYVANQGRHILITQNGWNLNEPAFIPGNPNVNAGRPFYSKYGWTQNLLYYCDCGNNDYNSFQSTFKVQQLAGYALQGSFTYQVAKGDGFGDDPSYSFLYNRSLGWGNEDYISHRQFTLSQTYNIPFGRGRKFGGQSNRVVDLLVGGWNVSGITSYYSGIPFTPIASQFPADYARPNVGPNDRVGEGSVSPYKGAQGNRNQWFVGGFGSAFLLPAPNTFGNYPVNSLYGPRFIDQDIALSKAFSITERVRFTLRTDAFNSLNHTNLGLPNADVTSPQAGQITSLANNSSMRRLQFSGRLDF